MLIREKSYTKDDMIEAGLNHVEIKALKLIFKKNKSIRQISKRWQMPGDSIKFLIAMSVKQLEEYYTND